MKTLKIALGLGLLLGVCGCNKLQEYNISTHNEVAVVLAIDGDTMQVYKTKNGVDDREILEKDRIITINLTSRVKYFTTDVTHDSQYSVSNNTISDSEKVGRISLSDISVGDPIRIEYYNTEPLQLAKITKKEVRIEELVYKSSNASDPTFTLSTLWFNDKYEVQPIPNLEPDTKIKVAHRGYWLYSNIMGMSEAYYAFVPD